MKKALFAIVILLIAFSMSIQADVLIYKLKVTSRTTGAGTSIPLAAGGFVVIDLQTFDVSFLLTRKVPIKRFFEYSLEGVHLDFPTTVTKNFSVISQAQDYGRDEDGFLTSDTVFLKGTDTALDIGIGSLQQWPKSFSGVGRSIYRRGDSTVIEETAIRLTFDKANTFTSNVAHDDLTNALNRLKEGLKAQGYVE